MHGLLVLAVLAPSASAKRTNVTKLLDEIVKLTEAQRFDKCLERVDVGLAEPRATDEQRDELAMFAYHCAVAGGDLARANQSRPADPQPGETIQHAYLHLNAGQPAEAQALVEGLSGLTDPLQHEVTEILAQAAALQDQLDKALSISAGADLSPSARAVIAEALLSHHRAAEALTLLVGTCEALEGKVAEACGRLAPIAQRAVAEQEAPQPEGAPAIPPTAVHRVDYATAQGAFAGGNAFVLRSDGELLALTALHLFGPRMGHPEQLASEDLPERIDRILFPHDAVLRPWEASDALVLPDAEVTEQMGTGDLAAFELINDPAIASEALEPSTEAPQEEQQVWLVAPGQHEAEPTRRLHAARIRSIAADSMIEFRFEEPIQLSGISGAPLLDASGRVIGMSLGGGMAGPQYVGLAIPVAVIQDHLDAAGR
ncbi:MAG TPA: serine protease [Deltaproteobacteria bacterium]|nr:serine protease [Deltaproteobacteria bacterium]